MRGNTVQRFSAFSAPVPFEDSTARKCSLHATGILTHDGLAVAECVSKDTGTRKLLCANCKAYVQCYQWAASLGYELRSEWQVKALSLVWQAPDGYKVPSLTSSALTYAGLGRVTSQLKLFESAGLVKYVDGRYLLRNACPSCYRSECASDCGLRFHSTTFAPRRAQTFP